MKVDVVDDLVGGTAIVLQDVVVRGARGDGEFLEHGQHFGHLVVGNIVEFGAVVFGDDQLLVVISVGSVPGEWRDGAYCVAGGEGVDV